MCFNPIRMHLPDHFGQFQKVMSHCCCCRRRAVGCLSPAALRHVHRFQRFSETESLPGHISALREFRFLQFRTVLSMLNECPRLKIAFHPPNFALCCVSTYFPSFLLLLFILLRLLFLPLFVVAVPVQMDCDERRGTAARRFEVAVDQLAKLRSRQLQAVLFNAQ